MRLRALFPTRIVPGVIPRGASLVTVRPAHGRPRQRDPVQPAGIVGPVDPWIPAVPPADTRQGRADRMVKPAVLAASRLGRPREGYARRAGSRTHQRTDDRPRTGFPRMRASSLTFLGVLRRPLRLFAPSW
jgi:hypothetical protein